MDIGKIKIKSSVFLAPMAGISDYPYRQLIRKMGCKLLYSEMVSSKGLVYGSDRSYELMEYNKTNDSYFAIQLFGEDPKYMAEAAKIIEEKVQPSIIDINMGCPMPKIVKNGSGAALMKNPQLAGKIIRAVVEAVDLPVSFKIRSGWKQEEINADKIALIGEEAGAKAVAVHARTRGQFYDGVADWEIIKLVKSKVDIPVIGNGDIFTPEDAKKMKKRTKCDGIMIGRGAQGNPWLIKRAIHYLGTGILLPEPSYEEVIKMALKHLQKSVDYFGEKVAVPRMRKHLAWYIKGMPYSTEIKQEINRMKEYLQLEKLLDNYLIKIKRYL
ncbi:tRNA dihydrouridine synthase DusB [Natronospora cellulosivora (SeqCode)]